MAALVAGMTVLGGTPDMTGTHGSILWTDMGLTVMAARYKAQGI